MPRFDLLDPDKYNRLTVQTSRGCPHRCEFCASSILLTLALQGEAGRKSHGRDSRDQSRSGRARSSSSPTTTASSTANTTNVCSANWPRNSVRWFTEADVRVAEDDELLGLMRDSGCQQVLIGLESPRRASLDGRRAEEQLEGPPTGVLPGSHRQDSILRHHRERLLHSRPRRRHAGSLRRRACTSCATRASTKCRSRS